MIKEWKELSRTQVFKKYSRLIEKVIFKLPDETTADFYVKREGPAAAIVALTKNNEVILVRQFRVGPQKILNELPGGYVDDGESGIEAMNRELFEETGYMGKIEFVGTCLDDAYSTMVRYCFVAKNCVKIQDPIQVQTEPLEVNLVTLENFRMLLRSGQMTDIEVGYLCLDYLNLL